MSGRRVWSVLVIVVAAAGVAVSAHANPGPKFKVDPTSGPPGSKVQVSSIDRCPQGANDVEIDIVSAADNANDAGSGVAVPNGQGAWSTSVTVDAGAAPGDYVVQASCFQDDTFLQDYDDTPFKVTSGSPSSTTTTAPPSSPAKPVRRAARFTG